MVSCKNDFLCTLQQTKMDQGDPLEWRLSLFELSVPFVCLFHYVIATEFVYQEFSTTGSELYCMQLIV